MACVASFQKNNACCLGASCGLDEIPDPAAVRDFVLVALEFLAVVESLREFALEPIYALSVFAKRFRCQSVPSIDYCISAGGQGVDPASLRLTTYEDDLKFSAFGWSTDHTVFGPAQASSRGSTTASPPGI